MRSLGQTGRPKTHSHIRSAITDSFYDTLGALCTQVARLGSGQQKFTMSVAYSPDSTRIAGGSIGGAVTLYDLTTGKQGSVQHQITDGEPPLSH